MPTRVKIGTFWLGTGLALVGIGLFTALGFWQWGRAEWKARLLERHAAALAAASVGLAEGLASVGTPRAGDVPAPIRVTTTGRYDAAHTVLLDNQRRGAEVGVLVFTRLEPDDGATPVLVNRGWLPLDRDRRPIGSLDPPAGTIRASGLLRPPPSAGLRLGDLPALDAPGGPPLLPWLDVDWLAAAWDEPLAPWVLELDPDSPGGFRRDADPLPNTLPPEQHRGYAVQWWGLAAAVAVIWLVLVARARRHDGHSTPGR
jgi:cytochrome oxidase assembly protein ShyY1